LFVEPFLKIPWVDFILKFPESFTKVVVELDYIDLIKLFLHKFLMIHFDKGKERKRSTSFMPGPQKLFLIRLTFTKSKTLEKLVENKKTTRD